MKQCGHLKRDGVTYCTRPAGWGTDHVGEGYCKLHYGNNKRGAEHPNFKHGKDSIYKDYIPSKLLEKVERFLESDPLDLTQELAIARTLLAEFFSRFETTPLDAISISILSDLIDRVTKTQLSISKVKNETALTAAEVQYLQMRAVDVALKYFPDDPQKQEQFITDLFGLGAGNGSERSELVEGTARRSGKGNRPISSG